MFIGGVYGGEECFHEQACCIRPVAVKNMRVAIAGGCIAIVLKPDAVAHIAEIAGMDQNFANNKMLYPGRYQLNVQALGIVEIGAGKEVVLIVEPEVCIAVYVLIRQAVIYSLGTCCEW